jgi:hypothetical protein
VDVTIDVGRSDQISSDVDLYCRDLGQLFFNGRDTVACDADVPGSWSIPEARVS